MNQLPVTSKGALGRAFAMLAGASALNCLPSSTVVSAAGVAVAAGAGDGDGEQLADTTAPIRTNAAIGRIMGLLRIGRAKSCGPLGQHAAIGQRQRAEDASRLAAA